MTRGITTVTAATAACACAAALTPAAHAATEPSVRTGGVANVAPTTVTLLGSVRPGGATTSYDFQYGRTAKYGARTARIDAGKGSDTINAAVGVAGLQPDTSYHYRLVARNAKGVRGGEDRTFKTAPQPLGFSLAATPGAVPAGAATVLSGALAGTGTAGRQVVLQGNPFPFTQGFRRVANPQVVNSGGAFAFPVLSLPTNTQYRVTIPDSDVVSPVVMAHAALRVSTKVSRHRVRRGRTIRFAGAVRPRRDGLRVAVQKLNRRNAWVTVAGTRTRASGSASFSTFAKRVRIRRGGRYRAFVEIADGSLVSAVGNPVRIRSYRRR